VFNWFKTKCPVESGVKRWTELRMQWLLDQFGKARLKNKSVMLPTDDFFPEPFDGSADSVRTIFKHVSHYMGIDSDSIELKIHQPSHPSYFNTNFNQLSPNWTGLYELHGDTETIVLESTTVIDPESLVATISHELAHSLLLSPKRISSQEEDFELLTDLTTVFFGMGIFTANVAFRDKSFHTGNVHGWTMSKQGYLTPEMWSYALALYAWLRNEKNPTWIHYLKSPIRSTCQKGIAYLSKADEEDILNFNEQIQHCRPVDILMEDYPTLNTNSDSSDDSNLDALSNEPDSDINVETSIEPIDDYFDNGVIYSRNGDWEEAIRNFSAAIQNNPQDSESYIERAWAYLEIGKVTEALNDAEQAMRLDPEDSEAFRVRGTACLYSKQFDKAISDLSRYLQLEDVLSCDGIRPSRAYFFRGLAYAGQGNLQKAIRDYSKAIHHWPNMNWKEPYKARADAYEMLGMPEKARADREMEKQLGNNGS
jgi:tetratricopeptide (TPR) repeat protein